MSDACIHNMISLSCFAALSKAQRAFSNTLINFKFECIGSEQTDDEAVIGKCLPLSLFPVYTYICDS